MPDHAFHKIDREDREQAYAEARWSWLLIGSALTLGTISALMLAGVI